ncbi:MULTISPECIES: FkbM family methyltransferase [Spirulina sp. CCY15215]|uniref:FkbM family methyltransferase n=1 Tax=Spirulina sp. CCY15215 TaxID=2767591 RepID=UPI00194F3E5C
MDLTAPIRKLSESLPETWGKYLLHCLDGFDPYMLRSYSQEGEDMILRRILEKRTANQFYVDVGAYHPKQYSNTYFFYSRGWSGINIDAMPGSMELFKQERPRDINLEIPIAKEQKKLTYFQFNKPALNTFSENLARSRDKIHPFKIIAQQEIETYPLKMILEKHLDSSKTIDFLSVDVEGLDLEVLQSNDWSKFRPNIVLIEILSSSLHSIQDCPIYQYLSKQNYHIYAKAFHTAFFVSDEYLNKFLL